ncbi:hypothetical protein FOZ61_001933 [Perkinsus olseni]|uniref:Uncharacterized protein n=1 Tax=Perkinsus olseni TaxID=32597 RepID=A0A7J6LV17_PEROL|nr:hypothetical protein FOZ61_001933 [Perkinsus olseni]KAF4671842.1 hypothetical protein FOL46_009847 [Perkinsus olseni]
MAAGRGEIPLLLTAGGKSLEPVSKAALSKAARMLGEETTEALLKAPSKRPARDNLLSFEAPLLRPKPSSNESGDATEADDVRQTGEVDHRTIETLPRPLGKRRKLEMFDDLQVNDQPLPTHAEEDITASELDALEAGLPIDDSDEVLEFSVVRRFPVLYVGLDGAGRSVAGASSTCPEDVLVGDEVVSVKTQVRAIVKSVVGGRAKAGLLVVDQDQLPGSRREFGLPTGCQLCWQGLLPGRKFHRRRDLETPLTLPGGWKFPSRLMTVDREWVDVSGRVASYVLGEGMWIGFEKGQHVLITGGGNQLSRLTGLVAEGTDVEVRNCWELPSWLVVGHYREYRADCTSVDIVLATGQL